MTKRKPKRMKRAYLNRWSARYINTGTVPNPEAMAGYNARAQSDGTRPTDLDILIGKLRNKEKHAGGYDSRPLSSMLDAQLPANAERRYTASQEGLKLERKIREKQISEKDKDFYWVDIVKGRFKQVRLYTSGNRHFFISINLLQQSWSKSIVYKGKDNAMKWYTSCQITWIETGEIPPGSLSEISPRAY